MSIKESLLWHQMHVLHQRVYELKFRVEFHANLQYKVLSSNDKLIKY